MTISRFKKLFFMAVLISSMTALESNSSGLFITSGLLLTGVASYAAAAYSLISHNNTPLSAALFATGSIFSTLGTTLLYQNKEYFLSHAISCRKPRIANLFLKIGADPNELVWCDHHYDTPLIHASRLGDINIVKHLLHAGANINRTSTSFSPFTPLIHAINSNHKNVAELLVLEGAIRPTRDQFKSEDLIGYEDQAYPMVLRPLNSNKKRMLNYLKSIKPAQQLVGLAPQNFPLDLHYSILKMLVDINKEDATRAINLAEQRREKETMERNARLEKQMTKFPHLRKCLFWQEVELE